MTRTRNMPRYDTTVSFHCHFLFLVKISLLKYWPKFRIPNSGQKLAFLIEICHFSPKFSNFSAKIANFLSKFLSLIGQSCVSVKNEDFWSKMTEDGHFWIEIALFYWIILYFWSKMENLSYKWSIRSRKWREYLKMVCFRSKMGVENTC